MKKAFIILVLLLSFLFGIYGICGIGEYLQDLEYREYVDERSQAFYYGCPNSKRVKKLVTKKVLR